MHAAALPCALIALLLAAAPAARADKVASACSALVPNLASVNQEPSDPKDYGRCTSALDAKVLTMGSNWCAFNDLGAWPAGPSPMAKKCAKFGRTTVYRGPVFGSEPAQNGACNVELVGSEDAAVVAVSTKYLKTSQHGWAEDKGACGQCMCIHIRGVDNKYNPGVKYGAAKSRFGLTFKGKVGDRCGECEDDHIDLLLDRPLAYAPWTPSNPRENQWAPYANGIPGRRGFGDPWTMRGGDFSPEAVGTWVSDWQFVPCSYTHRTCGDLFRGLGYNHVWEPQQTLGVNSTTMRSILRPPPPAPWVALQSRLPKFTGPMPTAAKLAMCGGMGSGCERVKTAQQCKDVQWANCPANTRCKRDSQWWWSCRG